MAVHLLPCMIAMFHMIGTSFVEGNRCGLVGLWFRVVFVFFWGVFLCLFSCLVV